jgi:ketosteroid isomerase-like protein
MTGLPSNEDIRAIQARSYCPPPVQSFGADPQMWQSPSARGHSSTIEPLEYIADFEEIQVVGEYAFEWGTYRRRMRPRAGGEATCYSGKLMRILKRQADGAWKMHRTMMTLD